MSEITYKYIRDYLMAIEPDDDIIIRTIRKDALNNNVPIIKSEVKNLLKWILATKKPSKVLEIGTAVAYSSIIMSDFIDTDGCITTIERSEDMIKKAKENIKKAGKENVITLLEGDASDILSSIDDTFDVIFMDAAKGQYLTFLPECLRLLKKGGILICDNVLQNGTVAKSRFSVPRRQRTIHNRMREFLWELNHNKNFQTSILPIADGVTLSYKKY
ncbi:O-methyltransferase [Vallitalea guaymasensis]|uniref:tRNA 5-hydroxyuridine methyltransferase n=1 Tax=Vallitalea guaymasensis TaxID=1185412 RepID=A0A8J8SDY8_9FIRM|nr:O-methyltransferase [Vallitalea guaymasensis]QUH31015.1 O-methyltransferase [Vallitalea guaymasensis]